jgi:hypothetical protein
MVSMHHLDLCINPPYIIKDKFWLHEYLKKLYFLLLELAQPTLKEKRHREGKGEVLRSPFQL